MHTIWFSLSHHAYKYFTNSTYQCLHYNKSIIFNVFQTIRRNYCCVSEDNFDLIPPDRIRNFGIVAHIDHGKSTLADRFLEITGAITKNSGDRILDNLQVERERGITVKAQTVTLTHNYNDEIYLLNLIDTPGHVDFANEVSRSLCVCDGVLLLVDSSQGIQAQTVENYNLAKSKNLTVIPVLNKIDMKNAKPDQIAKEIETFFQIKSNKILKISAKYGTGVQELLDNIVEEISQPEVFRNEKFRALVFDSWYDQYRGTLSLVFIKDGSISVGQEIQSSATNESYMVKSIYLLRPKEISVNKLAAGQVGLLSCNMRNRTKSIVGDTFHLKTEKVEILSRFKTQQPMVYAGIYSSDQSKNVLLRTSIEKLILNDSVVTIQPDSSPALGQGWRLGFLGLLHMEVFCQRLEQEYGAQPIITIPSVTYKVKVKSKKKDEDEILNISNPALFPDNYLECFEPFVKGTLITPIEYLGAVISLCVERRGIQEESITFDNNRMLLKYILPLSEIILDFNDKLKASTSGYASFSYEDYGYHLTNIIKLDILLNGKNVTEMCRLVHASNVNNTARNMVLRLKELIPKQMVQIAIQACVKNKVIARENIPAYRKDVTAKLYGGDVTRRMKLLKQQAEGKKKMRLIANVNVPQKTFIDILKR